MSNSKYPEPTLDKAIFHYVQDGNTLGTTGGVEELSISLETQLPGEKPFIVLRSHTGWSVDSTAELSVLINRCIAVVTPPKPCEKSCVSKLPETNLY